MSFGQQWWDRVVPACHPVLGMWGASGNQWFFYLSGETDIFQDLHLRVCQAVGNLRPFLCLPPGAWGQHAWSLEPPWAWSLPWQLQVYRPLTFQAVTKEA